MRILVNKILGFDSNGTSIHYVEASGDSTEDKPTPETVGGTIADGSTATESNTGKVFFWNEKTENWIEQFSFQS